MKSVSRMNKVGVPIDVETLSQLREHWGEIRQSLINRIDSQFGVYEDGHFRTRLFCKYLQREGITAWPHTEKGSISLSDDTFKEMSRVHPQLTTLRELRFSLGQLKLNALTVGRDGRNRVWLSPYGTKTGRNAPSNSKFIFGPATWLRSLLKPEAGRALAYIDYSAQEIGVAAVLSQDAEMIGAYQSGDPYLWLAKRGGYAPESAAKKTHRELREKFKVIYLAANYGMSAHTLSGLLGIPLMEAESFLSLHRKTFPTFRAWSQRAVFFACYHGRIHTVFGWQTHVTPDVNTRSLSNFAVQANAAEILRAACCLTTEHGIRVCCPVHDALLVEADESHIDDAVTEAQSLMADASALVLNGYRLRSDATIVRHPKRYRDPRGERMWTTVMELLERYIGGVSEGIGGIGGVRGVGGYRGSLRRGRRTSGS